MDDDRRRPRLREYVIVLVVIALVSVGALAFLGSQVSEVLMTSSGPI